MLPIGITAAWEDKVGKFIDLKIEGLDEWHTITLKKIKQILHTVDSFLGYFVTCYIGISIVKSLTF